MSPFTRRLLICLLVLVGLAATLAAQQARAPGERIVVLRNGRVLRGDLTRLGERSVLVLNNGGQVQLPTREIAVEANSLQEAYLALRESLVAPEKPDGHLELASWCMRENLHAQAAAELERAAEISPSDARISGLQRRLTYLTSAKPATRTSTAPKPPDKSHNMAQLEGVARTMPKRAVEEFTNSVQLLVVQSCASTRCHDTASSTAFQLVRPPQGQRFWRRLTLRNLHAVQQQLDAERPLDSPLLKMAATPHGGQKEGAPALDAEQFATLARWVQQAARSATSPGDPSSPTSTGEPQPLALSSKARPLEAPAIGDEPADPLLQLEAEAAEDPFDPAKFNEPSVKEN